jgi:hypothetical protein
VVRAPPADYPDMNAERLAVVQGWADTRLTLARWRRRPFAVVGPWAVLSLAVAVALLTAIWVVAQLSTPDPFGFNLPGVTRPAGFGDFALACVAGFIAGSALPTAAEDYSGRWRRVHDRAGPLAIGFVIAATVFSLCTQAYALGHSAADLSARLGLSPLVLLVGLLPHALPELAALFLPLAAWTLAARRQAWSELLAATFVTVAIAVPVLVAAAVVETAVTPDLIAILSEASAAREEP